MKQRTCNIYGCGGLMRPTSRMWDCGGKIQNATCRYFRCVECGNEQPWLDKPNMDGTAGELHCLESNQYSGLSMGSDINFTSPLYKFPDGSIQRMYYNREIKEVEIPAQIINRPKRPIRFR